MKPGQIATFSGSFVPDGENCIRESSMTLNGKLTDPEFIFRFSAIAPYVAPAKQVAQPVVEEPKTPAAPSTQDAPSPDPATKTTAAADGGTTDSR
jgi:hypothetical protein